MWTDENCPRYNRDKLRYSSDLTDEEWAHIEPLIPPDKPGRINGPRCPRSCRPEAPCMITLACGTGMARWIASIMCSTSSAEREPRAKPPHSLPHRWPEREKRRKGGGLCIDPPGFDAGKLIKGKKRYVLVDPQGLLLHGIVTAADVQRIATVASNYWRYCSVCFPFSGNCLPTAPIKGRSFTVSWPASCPTSRPRSSSDPIGSRASSSSPGVGWSNAPSLAQPLPRLAKDWENLNRIRRGMAPQRSYPTRYEAPHAPKTL